MSTIHQIGSRVRYSQCRTPQDGVITGRSYTPFCWRVQFDRIKEKKTIHQSLLMLLDEQSPAKPLDLSRGGA